MVVGGTTPEGATFVAKVDGGGPVRVAVADNGSMSAPVFTASQAVDAQGVAKVSISGLAADTGYWWQVEDNSAIDTSVTGRFRTHPVVGSAASFTVALAGDAGRNPAYPGSGSDLAADRISNHPVHETIRQRAVDEGWLAFLHLGDLHYYDLGSGSHGIAGGGSLANYRTSYDDVLAQSNQAGLYRDVAWHYQWDDHDYGPNDSDGTLGTKANALAAYGERVPHYALDGSNGIYQAWQIGRVQFVGLDVRYNRDPNTDPAGPTKTMLGTAQKTWLEGILSSSTAQALVVLSSSQWIGDGGDTWGSFADERDELVTMFGDHGWLDRMVLCHADRHAIGITGGATNLWGGFPIMLAATLDAEPAPELVDEERFDVVADTPGRDQYGTITVTDLGSEILLELGAWRDTTSLGSYTLAVVLQTPTQVGSAQVAEFAPLITGSHQPVIEARLITTYQEGDDPDGTDVPIEGGDVRFDATTEVLATFRMTTQGTDPTSGRSWFPRRATAPLAPYGDEIFVRRGVDIGSTILWSPLGYFRLEDTEQDDDPESPIRLAGSDRMAAIVEADMVTPRVFRRTTPVANVFNRLVRDVYPDATVVFDDSGADPIGRQLVVDDSRYEPLAELADGLAKVFYVDGAGRFRVEAAPSDDTIAWRLAAGRGGVLLRGGRRLSRRGAFNAVVVDGEGGGTDQPARGVAVDSGPTSPTRWGGRFGKVPRRESLPGVTTDLQAAAAAREILRRNLGAYYSADFGSIVNPALRPRMVLWVEQRNGDGEKHVVETLSIPLTVDGTMTGTTRERTLVSIGSQVG